MHLQSENKYTETNFIKNPEKLKHNGFNKNVQIIVHTLIPKYSTPIPLVEISLDAATNRLVQSCPRRAEDKKEMS